MITLRLCQHNYFSDTLVVLMCFCMWRNTQQQTAGTRSNGEPRYCAVTPLEALRSLRRLEPSHFPTAGATQLRITQPVPDDWSYYPRHILLPDRRILHQLRFHCQQAVHGEFILSYVKTTSSRRWCIHMNLEIQTELNRLRLGRVFTYDSESHIKLYWWCRYWFTVYLYMSY